MVGGARHVDGPGGGRRLGLAGSTSPAAGGRR